MNPAISGLAPTHPGETLREDVLPALGMSKTEIAKRLGLSRAMLCAILEERAGISPATALRLGRFLDTTAESWLNMQRDFDLRRLAEAMADELDDINPVGSLETSHDA